MMPDSVLDTLPCGLVRDVLTTQHHRNAPRLDLVAQGVQGGFLPVDQNEGGRAFSNQLARGLQTDAGRRSGDQRHAGVHGLRHS